MKHLIQRVGEVNSAFGAELVLSPGDWLDQWVRGIVWANGPRLFA